jgi:hypothetical protein
MSTVEKFRYEPKCVVPGCGKLAVYKIGATWSNGRITELKNYGTSCEEHRTALEERARTTSRKLHLAEGETLGDVTVYQFVPGARDVELKPVTG